jgi:hypothetical protein
MDHRLLDRVGWNQEERVDTLVDPVEMLPASSSRLPAAKAAEPPRASLPSLDPDAQVQWFSRQFPDEGPSSIDIDISWDEESDTAPTLVLRRRAH